jgi:cyclohexanecarboxylate-CoA ligase
MLLETTLTHRTIDERLGAGQWAGTRLQQRLERAVAGGSERVAAVDGRGALTWAELAEQSTACALGLLELGVRRGDVVTAQLPNWNEFVVLMLGVERIGAVLNPVAPIFRHRELGSMIRLARPVAAVVVGEFRGFAYPPMWEELVEEHPSVRHLVVVGDGPGGTLSWDGLLARGRASRWEPDVLELLAPDANEVCELIFTSGTTGEPKGVMHTHNTLEAAVRAMVEAQGIGTNDVIHMASTFAHQTGYLFGARLFIQAAGKGVFQDVWDPAAFVTLVEQEAITASFGATPFLTDVLRAPNVGERDLSSWRLFGCFGAPIPGPLLEEAAARLPCRVMPGWGMSEVNLVTTTLPTDPPEKVVSTDGAPLAGGAVKVIGEEGKEAAPGEEGDLVCRSTSAFVGYIQGRAFTEACYTDDGWFHTGDRARMDGDGFIRITGRSKDLIIRGGENVPVKEIEDLLLRHPKVAGVALVGAPDPRLGEVGCAFVVPKGAPPPTLEDLKAYLQDQRVTPQFWPERLVVLDEFPTTPSGKVQKYKLRDQLTAG